MDNSYYTYLVDKINNFLPQSTSDNCYYVAFVPQDVDLSTNALQGVKPIRAYNAPLEGGNVQQGELGGGLYYLLEITEARMVVSNKAPAEGNYLTKNW